MSDEHDDGRRRLLLLGAAAAAALPVGAGLLSPLGGATVEEGEDFCDVGPADEVREGHPLRVRLRGDRKDAWSVWKNVDLGTAFVLRDEAGEFVAFSSACPHLGCAVDWKAARERFECPCHEGAFARDGAVVSGPAPRPLDRLETRVRDGRLLVRLRRKGA